MLTLKLQLVTVEFYLICAILRKYFKSISFFSFMRYVLDTVV